MAVPQPRSMYGEAFDVGVRMKRVSRSLALFSSTLAVAVPARCYAQQAPRAPDTVNTALYRCNAAATQAGLPSGTFAVSYWGSGPESRASIPVRGTVRTFVYAPSANGARYVWGNYIWWDTRETTMTYASDGSAGSASVACRRVALVH